MIKIAIIGTGLSGISTALFLQDYADITLFEKAKGVSGRMSTRLNDHYSIDHGAQYFKVRKNSFRSFVRPLIDKGVVARWNARHVTLDGKKIIAQKNTLNDDPWYVGVPRMHSIVKYLARNLKVNLNTKITKLHKSTCWSLVDDEGNTYSDFDWVISAIPSVQTAKLLPNFFKYHREIEKVEMRPSFSLMLGFEKKIPLGFDAAKVLKSDISWISVDSSKPERNTKCTLLVNSSVNYAAENITSDKVTVMQYLMQVASDVIGVDLMHAEYKNIHSWRYANASDEKQVFEFIDLDHKLAACGDWCAGGRVEGAFISAYNLAKNFQTKIL